ncbi:MAG: aldose 1-epimerase family protein [Eubacteriales bacterium]|nr:aldose 1-epimerase family protein [Eubacteriales bacterium]
MSRYSIENEVIKIEVDLHGAELVSIVNKETGAQSMWSGDGAYWNRVSPVLFPFVGKLKDLSYTYQGKVYGNVPQHGYARDCDFIFVEKTEDTLWFELKDDAVWNERYPFHFLLRLGYRIEEKKVHVLWQVINKDEKEMPFSIGAHPAFIMPDGASKNGFYLDFHNGASQLICGELSDAGVLIPEKRCFVLEDGKLPLTDELFDKDALIIDSDSISTVSILTPEGKAFLHVHFNTPQLGIWSPAGKKAPFVCIEPWYGRCDRVDYSGDLSGREYGNLLAPGESFEREYVIELV